jgi:hypothetical protein
MHTTNPSAVTAARLEHALDLVAEVMLLHDRPQFAPYLDRLEEELATLQTSNTALARARARLGRAANDNARNREAA